RCPPLPELLRQPSGLLPPTLVVLVAPPWLGVRRLPAEFLAVTGEVVVVALPGRRRLGVFIRVSREGREWHSFAVATTGSEGAGRYCLVIRRAGGWTQRLPPGLQPWRPPPRHWARPRRALGAQDARLWLHVPRAGLSSRAHGGHRGGDRTGTAVPAGQVAGAVRVLVDRPGSPRSHRHRPG